MVGRESFPAGEDCDLSTSLIPEVLKKSYPQMWKTHCRIIGRQPKEIPNIPVVSGNNLNNIRNLAAFAERHLM